MGCRQVCMGQLMIPNSSLPTLNGLRILSTSTSVPALKSTTVEDFWAKNKRLKRPLSPHLTIYKPQATSMLSITHRITGGYMYVALTAVAGGSLLLPSSFPDYLSYVIALPFGGSLITLTKLAITWPFIYHALNGFRHLAWDLGYGFAMKSLYQTGYAVLIASIIVAAAVSLF